MCQKNERFLEVIQRNKIIGAKLCKTQYKRKQCGISSYKEQKRNYPNTNLEELDSWTSEWTAQARSS